ncbi:MAG TPA: hypothetical protein VG273_07250 [Bryobacteraceae bacterium]|jgi:hypothetical protein|nr:hypothetical protein [Bryobacteraceae bacterium]
MANEKQSTRSEKPRRGLSPHSPAPSALSGFGSTAGAGTLAGEATAGFDDHDLTSHYRRNFEQTFGTDGGFDEMQPAYDFGHRNASNERYRGKSWEQIENDLRTDYNRAYPASDWDEVRIAVRYAWERGSNRSRSAGTATDRG